MRTICFSDITLREIATSGEMRPSFKEKLETARALDRLHMDAIELPYAAGNAAELLANKTIVSMVKTEITAAVGLSEDSVAETWESVRAAKKPVLHVMIPTSTVQMEYVCHKKGPAVLELIRTLVSKCRFYCERVEFSALDAVRAERDFLISALKAAIEAGATRITLCDSEGTLLPDEVAGMIGELKEAVPELEKVRLMMQVSDAMHMGVACAAAAVGAGAAGVKTTAFPMGYPTVEEMLRFVTVKGPSLDITAGTKTTDISRTATQLGWMLSPKKEEPAKEAQTGEDGGICLDKEDGLAEVLHAVSMLGYELTDEDGLKVYDEFRRVAEKKQFVGTRELEAIIASSAMQVPGTYHLESYVVNSGNIIAATANIALTRDGNRLCGLSAGDGPIDAAFRALEQIIGSRYELDDFQIQSVTEGREAMGSALVKLRSGGRVYSGSGISTDIIGASIRAYISAVNKIVFEEA